MENIYGNSTQTSGNILLVEDNPAQSKLLKRWIETAGSFTVTIVENGNTGLRSVQDGNWDLVISDIHIPGLNGLELTRIMKAENINIPILLVTAHENLDATSQALKNQADDYLTKPFSKSAILSKIVNLIGHYQTKDLTVAA
jgi:two-component system, OmpR family, response regulator